MWCKIRGVHQWKWSRCNLQVLESAKKTSNQGLQISISPRFEPCWRWPFCSVQASKSGDEDRDLTCTSLMYAYAFRCLSKKCRPTAFTSLSLNRVEKRDLRRQNPDPIFFYMAIGHGSKSTKQVPFGWQTPPIKWSLSQSFGMFIRVLGPWLTAIYTNIYASFWHTGIFGHLQQSFPKGEKQKPYPAGKVNIHVGMFLHTQTNTHRHFCFPFLAPSAPSIVFGCLAGPGGGTLRVAGSKIWRDIPAKLQLQTCEHGNRRPRMRWSEESVSYRS